MRIIFCSLLVLMFVSRGYAMAGEVTASEILKPVAELPSKLHANANSLVWHPDGRQVAIMSMRPEIEVWDVAQQSRVATLRSPKAGSTQSLAYSPDGKYLAGGESTVGLWDAKTYDMVRECIGPYVDLTRPQPLGTESMVFSPDSRQLAVVYQSAIKGGYAIVFFDVQSGEVLKKIEGDGGFEGKLLFTPDGKRLVGAHSDYTESRVQRNRLPDYEIFFWDVESGQVVKTMPKVHLMSVTAFGMSDDGKWVATGSKNGERSVYFGNNGPNKPFPPYVDNDPVRLWDAATGKLDREFVSGKPVWGLAFSADGRYLITCHPGDLLVWNIATGERVQQMPYKTDQGLGGACARSPDGRRLVLKRRHDLAVYEFTGK